MIRPARILRTLLPVSVLLFAGAGCHDSSPGISVNIAAQLRDSGGGDVDLGKAYEGDWDRVCVLGPYSGNEAARATLGFDWNAEAKTAIRRNDGIAVLLFVRGKQVLAYAEHPRNRGDFAPLSRKCFPRAAARFHQLKASGQGGEGLYPKRSP